MYISKYLIITKLDLSYDDNITDDGIKNLTQMQNLNLEDNEKITDAGIKNMTQVQIVR